MDQEYNIKACTSKLNPLQDNGQSFFAFNVIDIMIMVKNAVNMLLDSVALQLKRGCH